MFKKKLSNITIIILNFIFLVTLVTAPKIVNGFNINNNFENESRLGSTGYFSGYTNSNMTNLGIAGIIAKIIAIALSLVGIFFLILMLYSGQLWLMSKGDTKDIEKAKENIKTALIGLIVILGAYAIVQILVPLISTWVV